MPRNLTKQDYLDRLSELLGTESLSVGVGSSLPRPLFDELADLFVVSRTGAMPDVAERVTRAAGIDWDEECDSRVSESGGGSTVTREGLRRLLAAVESTYAPDLGELNDAGVTERGIGESYREAEGAVTSIRRPQSTDGSRLADATHEHAETQNLLARFLRDRGIEPLSPRRVDPQFDAGWPSDDGLVIAEIKSVHTRNMVEQVRLGVGQLLHYGHQVAVRTNGSCPSLVLVTSRRITPDLEAFCRRNDIHVANAELLRVGEAVSLPGL